MTKSPYALPSLTQLASFEAAARNMSFKEAASELNVTSSAISHQIRALEDDLAVTLFDRSHRQIVLTEAGQALFVRLQRAFSEIATEVADIRAQGAMYSVSISATTAVSSLWLTPRISRFLKENSEYRVEQNLSDNPSRGDRSSHLHIVYGKAYGDARKAAGDDVYELFRDELVPVSSPEFASRYRHLSLPSLARLPLIALQSDEKLWTSWPDWFVKLDYLGDVRYSQKVNNYLIALQAAKEGAGVVLGWRNLLMPMIDRGELQILANFSIPAEEAFYLVTRPDAALNMAAKSMRDWLLNPAQLNMNFFRVD